MAKTTHACPKCGAQWEARGPVGFHESCPDCAAFLHTCANCAHYEPQRRDCGILTTDDVRDGESANFCEDFEPRAGGGPKRAAPPEKKTTADESRRKFDGLFRNL